MKRHGRPGSVVTNRLRSYGPALRDLDGSDLRVTGRWLNKRAENSHLPFRSPERAMPRFRRMRSLRKFSAVRSSVHNHFNPERHLYSQTNFKPNRAAAPAEWRELGAA